MTTRAAERIDKSSLANPTEVQSVALKLKLTVDFDTEKLEGWAEHKMKVLVGGCTKAVFDTKLLTITRVEVDGASAAFRLLAKHPVFGTPLEVTLKEGLTANSTVTVRIHYSNNPQADACQWLPPACTAGQKHPYLFTQSQAIHARSIFPCQDSPAVKVPYEAYITAPNWATVLMSAIRAAEKETMDGSGRRTFVWEQSVPVPAYLVALAVGELESREISSRVRIWAEPSVVDKAAYEFAQTEEFLSHAESLTMPYVWQRYDLLCLPPSFPYGGMENPCLTFVTPTLLAGDRSLADVVAHEIAHSWSGNLVTNATWAHFWLNEGWTMWIQRKVMTRIHGNNPLFFDLDAYYLGWKRLQDDIDAFSSKPELTALVPDLTGVDPDDAFSSVPYEKGFCLLYYIEQIVGSSEFEAFAQHYFQKFRYETVTSEEFRQTLLAYFQQDSRLVSLPWDDLFYKPGLPPMPKFNTSLAAPIEKLADEWYDGAKVGGQKKSQDTSSVFPTWSTLQKQIFLERLMERSGESGPMPVPTLEELDSQTGLSATRNSEIRHRWVELCLKAGAEFILPNCVDFITTQGRMKFTRSLYREMFKTRMGKQLAIDTFKKHQDLYHPICRKMVASDLGLRGEAKGTGDAHAGVAGEESGKKGGVGGTGGNGYLVPALFLGAAALVVMVVVRFRRR